MMMGNRPLPFLAAVLLAFCLVTLLRYAVGYPELPPMSQFSGFVFHVIGAKVLFVLALALSAYGFGDAAFGRRLPRFGFLMEEGLVKVFLGLIITSYAVFLLGLAGLLYRPAGYAVLAGGLACGYRGIPDYIRRLVSAPREIRLTLPKALLISVSAYFLIRGLHAAFMPPTGFDVLMYHYGVPKLYLDAHRIFPTPDINGSYFPFGVEMLYLLAMMTEGAISANLVNYAFAVAGGLAAAAFVRRFVGGRAGLLAFAVYVSIPMVVWLMPQAYIELGLAAYTMLAIHAVLAALKEKDKGWLVVSAVLAGFTMAIKYTGALTVAVLAAGVALHYLLSERAGLRRSLALAGLFLAIGALVSAPWYIKNLAYYGDPLYPFLKGLSGAGAGGLGDAPSQFWSGGFGRAAYNLVSSFWRTTFNAAEFQMGGGNGMGPYFLMFIPGLLMFRGFGREVRLLAGFCLLYFVFAVLTVNLRYASAVFPALAVLAACPVEMLMADGSRLVRALGVSLVAVFCLAALMANTPRQTVEGFPSAGRQAEDAYYSSNMSGYLASYATWKWINANLPEDAVIYQLWDDASVYFRERKTMGAPLPWGETGRQRVHYIMGYNGFAGFLPGQEMITNLRGAGAGYLLINTNREGRSLPDDPYFKDSARLIVEHNGVFLFQLAP